MLYKEGRTLISWDDMSPTTYLPKYYFWPFIDIKQAQNYNIPSYETYEFFPLNIYFTKYYVHVFFNR